MTAHFVVFHSSFLLRDPGCNTLLAVSFLRVPDRWCLGGRPLPSTLWLMITLDVIHVFVVESVGSSLLYPLL